jgi:hypothetical protein
MLRIFALTALVSLLSASNASAIGFLTQMNCASDYYAYCSQFQVGSKELRLCMSRVGPKLSKSCLNALIADGEVSKAEIENRKQEIAAAKSPAKQKPAAEQRLAEIAQKRETLALKQSTYEALKSREPKFIEVAAAVEAQSSGDEPEVPDPAKQVSMIVADPSPAHATKSEKPRERSNISRSKPVKIREAVRHAKSKTKVAAHKVETQRSAERSRHKDQNASK